MRSGISGSVDGPLFLVAAALAACSSNEPTTSGDVEGFVPVEGGEVQSPRPEGPGPWGQWNVTTAPPGATAALDPVAPQGGASVRAYVDDALDIMEESGLYAEGHQWDQARAETLTATQGMTTNSFVHLRLREAADVAGGRHTSLLLPSQVDTVDESFAAQAGLPASQQLSNGVAYLSLVSSGDGTADVTYENVTLKAIKDLDHSCGWVLDSREHTGGSAVDSLGAAAPFISPGPNLAWRERGGDEDVFSFEPRLMRYPEFGRYTYSAGLHQPAETHVAVLTPKDTASAGEAVVVALLGQENTRLLGQPTKGLTTANTRHVLADGAVLILTEAFMVDHTGTPHDNPIQPDVPLDPSLSENTTLNEAATWLAGRC